MYIFINICIYIHVDAHIYIYIHVYIYIHIGPTALFLLKTVLIIALYTRNNHIPGITVILTNSSDLTGSMWNCHYYARILIAITEEQDCTFPWFANPKCLNTQQTKAFCVRAHVSPKGCSA